MSKRLQLPGAAVWDGMSGAARSKTLDGHFCPVYCVVLSKDGKLIVSGSQDGTICIWDTATGKLSKGWKGHERDVMCVAISQDCKYIASGSDDRTIKVWNVDTGEEMHTLGQNEESVSSVAISSMDGICVATGSSESVRLWNLKYNSRFALFMVAKFTWMPHENSFDDPDPVTSIAFSKCGDFFVSGSSRGCVQFWYARIGEKNKITEGDPFYSGFVRVGFSDDDNLVCAASTSQCVRVWQISPQRELFTRHPTTDCVSSIAVSSCNRRTVLGLVEDYTLRIQDIIGQEVCVLEGHTGLVNDIAISDCGGIIVSASEDGTLRVWVAGVDPPEDVLEKLPSPSNNLILGTGLCLKRQSESASTAESSTENLLVTANWFEVNETWNSMSRS